MSFRSPNFNILTCEKAWTRNIVSQNSFGHSCVVNRNNAVFAGHGENDVLPINVK